MACRHQSLVISGDWLDDITSTGGWQFEHSNPPFTGQDATGDSSQLLNGNKSQSGEESLGLGHLNINTVEIYKL